MVSSMKWGLHWGNGTYAKGATKFVDDGIARFALREIRRLLYTPRTWAIIAAVSLLLGLAAPFNTDGFLRFWPRVVYWFSVVVLTYSAGAFTHITLSRLLQMRAGHGWLHHVIAGLTTGAFVSVILLLINWAALGVFPIERGYTLWLVFNVVAISLVISIVIGLADKSPAPQNPPAQRAKLLDRLPINQRGALISLSVLDHYVEVTTSAAQTLVLMRLSDAIAETEGVTGLQVHRSHWVAVAQVQASNRAGDKAVLTMCDGRDIPVSRTYIKAVRDAGLLPR